MRYICMICGYVYDDAKEKVPFESLPASWKCPLCGAAKSDFKPEETPVSKLSDKDNSQEVPASKMKPVSQPANANPASAPTKASTPPTAQIDTPADKDSDLKKLSPDQLSALCSNLARGCEKQYKPEEAGLFRELADYFASVTPAIDDASVENIAALLWSDIDNYSGLRAAADEASDRGAARVCVWGERVTRMLSSLVIRYLNEGEALLADTNIWVCTVCGFVFIGDEAPELCPVCKVPAWKFEKIEGGK
ncbi:MAG: rubredoxin [Lachnospiraceae bacterium]|nr:rubredoxin [Lachnospiraceae bacterium]